MNARDYEYLANEGRGVLEQIVVRCLQPATGKVLTYMTRLYNPKSAGPRQKAVEEVERWMRENGLHTKDLISLTHRHELL